VKITVKITVKTMMSLDFRIAQEVRAQELGLPIPGTRKRRRHNHERREFRGISHRQLRRVREMRDAMVTE
jgi:hypothetical protein